MMVRRVFHFDVVAISLLIVGIAIRYSQLGFVSDDLTIAFLPWYREVASKGFPAIGENFYTYSSLLIFSYWIMSFFGAFLTPVVLVKIPVLLFELLLAAGFGKIVASFASESEREKRFSRAFAFVYLLPTVVLNGAAWGQCDALYGAGVVCAVAFLVDPRGPRSLASHLAFGASLVFKLQCIFFAPIYLILYLRRNAKPFHLLAVVVIYVIGMVPAILAGRTVESLVLVYLDQSKIFRSLSMNAPNIYAWISDTHYDVVYPVGVLFAAVALLAASFGFSRRWRAIGPREILALCAFFAWLSPNLLPKMHERYFFAAEILILAVALTTEGKNRWIPWLMTILFQVVTLLTYARYLYRFTDVPMFVLPFFHLALGGLWVLYFRDLLKTELKTSHPIDEKSAPRLT